MSKEIFTLVEFKLKKDIKISEWKVMSDWINELLSWVSGFQFRDSATDENWNVYCILKWDSAEASKEFDKILEEKPEMIKEFENFIDMETMKMKNLNII